MEPAISIMDKFYVELKLSHRAIIQYSIYTWKRATFKEHIARIAMSNEIIVRETISSDMHEKLNSLRIPEALRKDLKLCIGTMGTRIKHWLQRDMIYVERKTKWEDYVPYLDHIHWTSYGCIDTTETLRSLYFSGLLPINYLSWINLCNRCVEDCIKDFWKTIGGKKEYRNLVSELVNGWDVEPHRIYWYDLVINRQNGRNSIFDDRNFENDNTYMCKLLFKKKRSSYRYFWNTLDDDQRKSLLLEMFDVNNSNLSFLKEYMEEDAESFMFLIKELSYYGLENISLESLVLFMISEEMIIWPCGDIFKNAFKELSLANYTWLRITDAFIHLMRTEREYSGDDSRTREWFYSFFNDRDNPKYKQLRGSFIDCLPQICSYEDMKSLRYIFANETSTMQRARMLNRIISCFKRDYKILEMSIRAIEQEVDLLLLYEFRQNHLDISEEDV